MAKIPKIIQDSMAYILLRIKKSWDTLWALFQRGAMPFPLTRYTMKTMYNALKYPVTKFKIIK
jgi:hypothetical protein